MPIKHAAIHITILKRMLLIALKKFPCWIRFKVSSEKVENVVNPPSSPIVIANRISTDTTIRSMRIIDEKPINRDPRILTIIVPYGNLIPSQFTQYICTRYLSTEPMAPPIAMPAIVKGCSLFYVSLLFCRVSKLRLVEAINVILRGYELIVIKVVAII